MGEVLELLGQSVRRERVRLGWSQERLAGEAGLHRTYVSAVERGRRNVSIVAVVRLSRALGVPVAALTGDLD